MVWYPLEKYNFDNFLEGDCNRLARSAGFAVANNPAGTAFNPLMIFGGVVLLIIILKKWNSIIYSKWNIIIYKIVIKNVI